jgi:hypothetical protein
MALIVLHRNMEAEGETSWFFDLSARIAAVDVMNYKLNIAKVLDLSTEDGMAFFAQDVSRTSLVAQKLRTLCELGLGYLKRCRPCGMTQRSIEYAGQWPALDTWTVEAHLTHRSASGFALAPPLVPTTSGFVPCGECHVVSKEHTLQDIFVRDSPFLAGLAPDTA